MQWSGSGAEGCVRDCFIDAVGTRNVHSGSLSPKHPAQNWFCRRFQVKFSSATGDTALSEIPRATARRFERLWYCIKCKVNPMV